ncbi:acyl-CoA synthetase [Vibrio coralliilyticus]|uniref:DUF3316 domain-containing protein n=1 Tax=Vibrio coralliilyticus TaxID=190893 RepID=UPI000BAAE19F|nr:DUF3316 domain-containing protein [Vibrio coralliilyticus]PAU36873.1 acyl-CoA synthetase [Vibrio coralliilyticus]
MIKLISLSSVLLFSSFAVAGLSGNTSLKSVTMTGDIVQSSEAAFSAGHAMADHINNKSPYELSRTVDYYSGELVDTSSFKIIQSSVSVKELVNSDGEVAYQPVLSVDYKYRTHSSSNRD